MDKPRILVTTSTFPRWANDTDPPFLLHLCAGLSEYFDIHVLAPHCTGAATEEQIGAIQVHRYRYAPEFAEKLAYDGGLLRKVKNNPLYTLLLPFFLGCQWLAVRKLHRKYRFSGINAHWIIPQGIVAAFFGPTIPLIVTSHGGDLFALKSGPLSSLKTSVLSRAKQIIVVSNTMVGECVNLGIPTDKVSVQSMGVDTQRTFVPPPDDQASARKGLLFVGRLVEKKGVSVLIDAIKILRDKDLAINLTIVGDGPDRESLEMQADRLGLASLITFTGAKPNPEIVAHYQQAKVLAFPAVVARDGDQEGLGLVSVEALACGCPVIASDLPAIRDAVSHENNGLMVKPNSPGDLADAIERLLQDRALYQSIASQTRTSAIAFDWDKVCSNYSKILLQAMVH
jgi:glycosyltransferase involved in cell wall biosynthesis